MHNTIVLIGRLTKEVETKENTKGTKYANFNLAVQRSYKNDKGVYETDFIDCVVFNSVAENISEYCKTGDLISVKGTLQNNEYEVNGEVRRNNEVVVERVCFLSSARDIEKKSEKTDKKNKKNKDDIEM